MSNDVFFYRAGESFDHIGNEFTDFLPEVVLHPKFLLNCGVLFAANSCDGVLLDRVNPLLCKLSLQREPLQQRPFVQKQPLSATAIAAMVLAAGPTTTAVAAATAIAAAAATAVSMMAVTAASDDWRSFGRVFSMSVNNDYLYEKSISEALI